MNLTPFTESLLYWSAVVAAAIAVAYILLAILILLDER